MIDPRFLDPAFYKVGAVDIGQFQWLHERLTIHGHPLTKYDDTFKRRVQNFQWAQGWTGAGADGYVGKVTLQRLAADPVTPVPINLSKWKLTLPTPLGGDDPEEIYPIGTFEKPPWFDRILGAILFRAPVEGATTPNSSYPRSELREMDPKIWSNLTGVHEMVIEQAITAVPGGKPHVVAGQIHDAADDVIMIRLEGKRLFVESRGNEIGDLNTAYELGTRFRVALRAEPGMIRVFYNGVEKARLTGSFSGCYFKAGCYTQANESNGSGYGEVVVYALTVTHATA